MVLLWLGGLEGGRYIVGFVSEGEDGGYECEVMVCGGSCCWRRGRMIKIEARTAVDAEIVQCCVCIDARRWMDGVGTGAPLLYCM